MKSGAKVLEIGCGGGLLTEEIAKLDFEATGIDPSAPSIEVAKAHAERSGLDIDYRVATGERLPFADTSFSVVCCCDVLEHVNSPEEVIREAARVLAPGGTFLYCAPNRTLWSYLTLIWTLQRWPYTRVLPKDLHAWRAFIKPAELVTMTKAQGIANEETVGLSPTASSLESLRLFRKVKRGELSFKGLGERLQLRPSRDLSVEYAGYGLKTSG